LNSTTWVRGRETLEELSCERVPSLGAAVVAVVRQAKRPAAHRAASEPSSRDLRRMRGLQKGTGCVERGPLLPGAELWNGNAGRSHSLRGGKRFFRGGPGEALSRAPMRGTITAPAVLSQ